MMLCLLKHKYVYVTLERDERLCLRCGKRQTTGYGFGDWIDKDKPKSKKAKGPRYGGYSPRSSGDGTLH
jgi:hypothetical protein